MADTKRPAGGRRRLALFASVAVPALLYLAFVWHYSVNVPYSLDDWSMLTFAGQALHGHVTLSSFWAQYGDRRPLLGRLLFVAFAEVGGFNIRIVILFSALLLVASFGLLLALMCATTRIPFTPLRLGFLAVLWFSLADFQNALWGFQVLWYLVLFLFLLTAYLLLVPSPHRNARIGLALMTAVACSLTDIEGLIVWPLGLACVLVTADKERRTREGLCWGGAALVTFALYAKGFDFSYKQCANCTTSFDFGHPVEAARFLVALIGNVIPTGPGTGETATGGLPSVAGAAIGLHELVGAALLAASVWILVRAIRHHRLRDDILPLLLITFGFSFDLLIVTGRAGSGVLTVVEASRYTMPNLLWVVGLCIYAMTLAEERSETYLLRLGAVLLVFQCIVATGYGIAGARVRHQALVNEARVLADERKVPNQQQWQCEFDVLAWRAGMPSARTTNPVLLTTQHDGLSIYHSASAMQPFRKLGLPRLPQCDSSALTPASLKVPRTSK
jgi:hypothetical protein